MDCKIDIRRKRFKNLRKIFITPGRTPAERPRRSDATT
jgi:hypothetical protein